MFRLMCHSDFEGVVIRGLTSFGLPGRSGWYPLSGMPHPHLSTERYRNETTSSKSNSPKAQPDSSPTLSDPRR